MNLTDNEKRDITKLIEEGKNLPEKYRFLLFDESKQVELTWNGKSEEITNVVLPFQIIEQIDEPRNEEIKMAQGSFNFASGRQLTGWTNKLIWGDNKYILSSLKNGPMRQEIEKEGGIKLVYIDPPFDVGADFSMNVDVGDISYEKKPNVLEHIAYRDTWGLGQDSFLSMIYERLNLINDLMSENSSIYVHSDWHVNSRLRLVLDEVFGKDNFKNEIIWKRFGAHNDGKKFGVITDSIFYYTKGTPEYYQQSEPYDEEYIKERFTQEDDRGRFYPNVITGKGPGPARVFRGKSIEPPKGRHWTYVQETIDKLEEENRIYYTKNGTPFLKQYLDEQDGRPCQNLWTDIQLTKSGSELVGYPTQKPEKLIERIIQTSTTENDIVADFFVGSGTTAAVAEKLNRKWICCDLGKFSIHTTRKRMIGIQRELKKEEKNWRAFEILNLGKYQREHYIYDGKSERDECKKRAIETKEKEFRDLILEAYKATSIDGFATIHGKKGEDFISLGPINQPLSRNHVEEVIAECIKNKIISVHILGFEYEMGLFPTIQEEAESKGLRLSYKQIPMEVFDKRAISNGEVVFHNVAFIDFETHIDGNELSIELTDFQVFYNAENLNLDESLGNGKSKIIVENGLIVEKKKDKDGIISEKILTEDWHDWIDYWSVDFDYESKPEIIKFENKNGEIEEECTGNFVFENEWQSFRGKYKINKNERLELKSSKKEIAKGKTKVAVKVVDIFGNDTMKVREVEF